MKGFIIKIKKVPKVLLALSLSVSILMMNTPIMVNAYVNSSGEKLQLIAASSNYYTDLANNPIKLPDEKLAASKKNFGLVDSPVKLPNIKPKTLDKLAVYPASFDLRATGKVTSVKNQSTSGSCWSFAACASLESQLLPGENRDFSENNLKNNSGFDLDPNGGGNYTTATAYLARWSGPINESDDPFNPDSTISPSDLTVQKNIQNVDWLSGRTNYLDNDFLKNALMKSGAVYTSMFFEDTSFNDVYDTYYNSFYWNDTNHAVTIVGWDDNFDKNKFVDSYNGAVPPGNGAFIVKNSWGTWWGDNGYFYVSYYDENFAVKGSAVFNGAEWTTNYKSVYQYDPLGLVGNIGYNTEASWMSNVFTATASEDLSAVSFYTIVPDTSYDVYICSNYTYVGDLTSNRVLKASGLISEMGYHTIKLNSAVPLTSGRKFAVIVKINTPGYGYQIPIESAYSGYSSKASAGPGQSYISSSGASWGDLTTYYETANVCLKAFTNSVVNVTSVSLNKTSGSLKVGGTDNLIATINPADARDKNVTWESSNTSVAAVDNAGKVTGISEGTATITVKTADGGFTASCSITVASNEKPVISGALDKTIMVGDSLDVKAGVTAADKEDGNLTSKIVVTGSVDTGRIGQYAIIYSVTDSDGNKVSKSITINVAARNIQVISLIGSDRYDTAVKLSQSQFAASDSIIIVNGEAMADGLGATPLAAYKKAPLLLTDTKALPNVTINEIKRLKAKNAIIVGGAGVVTDNVKSQLQSLGLIVERISGSDRYGTSLAVAEYIDKNCYDVSKIVVSNGYGEADALSIASAAGRDNMPIILTEKNNIPAAVYDWLKSESIVNAYIIGGTGIVSDNVLNKIDAITAGDIRNNRLGGIDRFETNSLVIDRFYGSVINKTYIAKGYLLIDALAAGSVSSINGAPVVLADKDLNISQKTVIGKRYGNTIIRAGGGISDTAVNSLKNCLQ